LHTTAIDEESHFKVYEDTPVEMVQQMLNITYQTGRTNLVRVVACEWMGKECTTAHLLRDCQMFKKKTAKEKTGFKQVLQLLEKNHRSADCRSPVRCGVKNCGKKHNIALHDAWQEKAQAVAMLTRTKSPISLLTTPVVLSLSTVATILLCIQEVADTIGLDGESRPLGLAVFGNPNQVQQAFKTTVAIADNFLTTQQYCSSIIVYSVSLKLKCRNGQR
jgi:hypothetical protein